MKGLLQAFIKNLRRYCVELRDHVGTFAIMIIGMLVTGASFLWAFKTFMIAQDVPVTLADVIIWIYDPADFGVSFVWTAAPIFSLLWLSRLWADRESPNWIVRQKSHASVWGIEVFDMVLTSILVGLIIHLFMLAAGLFVSEGFIGFDDPRGLFARYAPGCVPDASFAAVALGGLVFCWLALMVTHALFALLRRLMGSGGNGWAAFVIVALLGLPQIHGKNVFLLEMLKALFPLASQAVNPLSYLYGSASIFYPTWAFGTSHGFLFLIGVFAVVIGIGTVYVRKRGVFRK
ncbi:MAG: hypothetical protein LBG81_02775 [Coriobacteriaceae bacterium]|nr:hypothetical protein [Coriobacteriaceae bacterium]